MIKKFLLFFWNKWVDLRTFFQWRVRFCRDAKYVRRHPAPTVLSIADTIDLVVRDKLSVSRFGDGEIKLVAGRDISFQKMDTELQKKLTDVLSSDDEGVLVCLPDIFGDRKYLIDEAKNHWRKHLAEFRPDWYANVHTDKTYGNAFMSRCYFMLRDKSRCGEYFQSLRRIWDGQDVLLVEGEKSRLGVGNDLLDNAKSIRRVLGPVRDAWAQYDALLEAAKKYGKDKLILLALGPTASVMVYALFKEGYRAVDLGHADIEYEWYLSGATKRVPVKDKFVNEAGAGEGVGALEDETYLSQILEIIESGS